MASLLFAPESVFANDPPAKPTGLGASWNAAMGEATEVQLDPTAAPGSTGAPTVAPSAPSPTAPPPLIAVATPVPPTPVPTSAPPTPTPEAAPTPASTVLPKYAPPAAPLPVDSTEDLGPETLAAVVEPSPVHLAEEQAALDEEGGMPLWLWVTILIAVAAAMIGFILILTKWRGLSKL